jgi:hypothetical protein
MAKVALGTLAFLAIFVALVLVGGSIEPQPAPSGRAALGVRGADQAAARRSTSDRTSGATPVPKRSIERSTSR